MTEELIIDGVDVSGCDRLRTFHDWAHSSDKWCGISNDGGCECEHNINYYYKQLKRLEQENKELKEENITAQKEYWKLEQGNDFLAQKVRLYRSALEEIREKAQHCISKDVCALCDYSKECAVPDADGLVYDNNRLLIKLINEVLNESK